MAMEPLIRLEQVSKLYQMGDAEVHALRAIDFSLDRGDMVAVMGSSGSGKSTLLNVVGTLDRPTSGRYVLDGEPVPDLSETALAELR